MNHPAQSRKRAYSRITSEGLILILSALLSLPIAQAQQNEQPRQLTQPAAAKGDAGQTSYGRVALVIGNGNYRNASRLNNPINDARDIATTLRAMGFNVLEGEDQTYEQMRRLILDFGDKLKAAGGVGFFYYAGHGLQVAGRNYLVPVDASSLRERTIEFEAVDVNRVLAEMEAAGNGFNIVVLDACRSNPFTRGWRSSEDGLAQINAPAGTIIAYATSPGEVAADGEGRNGLYTAQLLHWMRQPGLPIEGMFKQVRIAVRSLSGGKQVPWESTSISGEFYFGGKEEVKTTESTSNSRRQDVELALWETIKNSNDAKDFNDYLTRYPDGVFSGVARRRLTAIAGSKAANGTDAPSTTTLPPTTTPTSLRITPGRVVFFDKYKHESYIEYGPYPFGGDAFTLYLDHHHGFGRFEKFRKGKMIITRIRIGFVPGEGEDPQHAFFLPRNNIKEIRVAGWDGPKHILLRIEGRKDQNYTPICYSGANEDGSRSCSDFSDLLDFFTIIVTDFDRAVQEFQKRRQTN
jgi:hypothetical protein